MRHAVKKQQHIEGQQYRDGLIQVIKRIKPGMPSSTYLDVAEIFIKYGYGFTPNQRREMLGMLGKEKIRLSPNVLIMRGQIKRDYKKEDYMKANNHRLKAAWAYYFTHKRKLYNKQGKSQNPNWKNVSHKDFIAIHTDKLDKQKKNARCLQLQGIVSQTKNAQIKAHGEKEMQALRCKSDKQFEKQLARVSGQTKLRSAAKQLKANPKKVQQMREQFQKYNKICAKYGGYYGMKEVNGKGVPVCKAGVPVALAEKGARVAKLQALARGRKVRKNTGGDDRVAKMRQTALIKKGKFCDELYEKATKVGGAEARKQYNIHKCKLVRAEVKNLSNAAERQNVTDVEELD